MRVDKFLKNSRIIKRRTMAKEACEHGKIKVNGKIVKAGYNLEIGDIVDIEFASNTVSLKVLELKEHVRKDDAENLYEIIG